MSVNIEIKTKNGNVKGINNIPTNQAFRADLFGCQDLWSLMNDPDITVIRITKGS